MVRLALASPATPGYAGSFGLRSPRQADAVIFKLSHYRFSDLTPYARGGLLWRAKAPVLLQDVTVRHSRHVVADNPVQRLASRLFLVACRQLSRKLHKERKHLRDHLLGLLLITLLRRTVINVLVEKVLDLPALGIHLRAEGNQALRISPHFLHRRHARLADQF